MSIRSLIISVLFSMALGTNLFAVDKTYKIPSPSGDLTISISAGKQTCWSIAMNGTVVLQPSELSMTLSDGTNAHRAACDYKHQWINFPADGKFYVKMAPDGGMDPRYEKDAVHPNTAGYKVMEKAVLDILNLIDKK